MMRFERSAAPLDCALARRPFAPSCFAGEGRGRRRERRGRESVAPQPVFLLVAPLRWLRGGVEGSYAPPPRSESRRASPEKLPVLETGKHF
jgi:hypothetical protein